MSTMTPPGPKGPPGDAPSLPHDTQAESDRFYRRLTGAALAVCLLAAGLLAVRWRTMGGPGDQLLYFTQAGRLLPFRDNYYGPVYFVALRVIHDLLPLSWFAAGKLLSWLSLVAFLLLCQRWLRTALPANEARLALVLVAINPILIGAGFAVATDLFGACWVLAGVLAASRATLGDWRGWLATGLLFGIALLTRFASLGFAMGAVLGILALPSGSIAARVRAAGLVLLGCVGPPALWSAFLLLYQGSVPPNYNFIHLTMALGRFHEFREVPDLIARYGSMWGVVTSDWTAAARIVAFGASEAVKFPFQIGFQLYFLAAGFLVPGLLLVMATRRHHGPWLIGFLLGTFLMGIGSREWVKYYVVILPLGAVLIVTAMATIARQWSHAVRVALGASLLAVTVVWTGVETRRAFLDVEWTELATARGFLERERGASTVMTSTASTLSYGCTIPFVDLDTIIRPADSLRIADVLRGHGVTDLVILERHSLWEHPYLAPLLADSVRVPVPGLRRDTLILKPRRAAIYHVELANRERP